MGILASNYPRHPGRVDPLATIMVHGNQNHALSTSFPPITVSFCLRTLHNLVVVEFDILNAILGDHLDDHALEVDG